MTEKPILFKSEMVRAILSGHKTQTRRIVKPQPPFSTIPYPHPEGYWMWQSTGKEQFFLGDNFVCPFGKAGDVLWVREAWAQTVSGDYIYAANHDPDHPPMGLNGSWKPSIHMPKAACRLRLEVLSVWLERIQDISSEHAIAEGIEAVEFHDRVRYKSYGMPMMVFQDSPIDAFSHLWRSINGAESWDFNCWVWVVEFKKV